MRPLRRAARLFAPHTALSGPDGALGGPDGALSGSDGALIRPRQRAYSLPTARLFAPDSALIRS